MNHLKHALLFLYLFLTCSFVLGSFTLAMIIESFVFYLRNSGWLASYENAVVIIIIIICLSFCFFTAKWTTKWLAKTAQSSNIFFVGGAALALSLLCFWYWLMPNKHSQEQVYAVSTDNRFIVGPYPTKAKLLQLKQQGYSAVISLLDPYVLPFEFILLKQEQAAAQAVGIQFISIPMLPWVSNNKLAVQKIEQLKHAKNFNKYYVHCYYNRDRIYVFMRLVNKVESNAIAMNANQVLQSNSLLIENKTLQVIDLDESKVFKLDQHTSFALLNSNYNFLPIITELGTKYFNTPIRTLLPLNPSTANDVKALLKNHKITSFPLTIKNYPYNPEQILGLANLLKSLPSPLVVYDISPNLVTAVPPASITGLMLSYLSGLPSLPWQLFAGSSLHTGKVELLAPNVAIGPLPLPDEYASYLYPRGIRSLLYVGDCSNQQGRLNAKAAAAAELQWVCAPASETAFLQLLHSGGPWYVYGPNLATVLTLLRANFSHSPNTPPMTMVKH